MSEKLGVLQLDMQVNVTDRQLLTNLHYCKSLNLPKLRFAEPNGKTIAIVGSGPSLWRTHSLIPPDCDILALNGAYKFLRKQGRIPQYFAMLDARAENVNFIDEAAHSNTLFLLSSQVHPRVFDELKDLRVGMFHLNTPTTNQVFPDEPMYIGGGGTIGLTAIGVATALGYRHVVLYGFDSSWEDARKHVQYQPQNRSEKAIEIWVEDRKYWTSHAMAAQVMDFFPYHEILQKTFPGYIVDIVGDGLFYDFVTTNNNPSTRERELSKYAEAYQMEDYGMTQERKDGIDNLLANVEGCRSYLDVSTGRGETLELAKKHGFNIVCGTETVEALLSDDRRIYHGILPSLPIPTKDFDVVSLFEVIEHLVPEDVEPALRELTRIAKKHILISAAVQQCWIGGVNLHPSSRSVEAWQELFDKVWHDKVYRVGNLGGSPVWRVDL